MITGRQLDWILNDSRVMIDGTVIWGDFGHVITYLWNDDSLIPGLGLWSGNISHYTFIYTISPCLGSLFQLSQVISFLDCLWGDKFRCCDVKLDALILRIKTMFDFIPEYDSLIFLFEVRHISMTYSVSFSITISLMTATVIAPIVKSHHPFAVQSAIMRWRNVGRSVFKTV